MSKRLATWRLPRERCVENTDRLSAHVFAVESIEMNAGSRGQYQKIFFIMNPNAIDFQFSPPLTFPYWHLALFCGMQLRLAK